MAASQTVHAGNLVVMDEDHSFVVPLATDFGWHLKEAVQNLTYEFGTGDLTTLYERNGIYCFDAWVQPGPQKKDEKEKNSANSVTPGPQVSERSLTAGPGVHTRTSSAVTPGKVSERSLAAPGVRLSTEVEERSIEIAEEDSQWRPVKGGD